MLIEEITPDEIEEASLMIKGVFKEFISSDYTAEGIFQFNNFIDEKTIKERLSAGSFILVAKNGEKIAGLIEIRDGSHIPLFFVRGDCHGLGIGRKLFRLAVKRNSELNPAVEMITVNSSQYAVEIYKSLGFRNSAPMQVKSGIQYFPMQYAVKY